MRTTARMPKHNPRPSFNPLLPSDGEALDEEARCGGMLLDGVCAAVASEVATGDATLLEGQALASTASLQASSVKCIEQVS